MAKNQHIVAVEIEHPDFTGFKAGDVMDLIRSDQIVIGFRPTLEEMDPRTNVRPDGKVTLQVIPYIVIRHREKVLVYVRPTVGNEDRLHGKVSIMKTGQPPGSLGNDPKVAGEHMQTSS